MEGWIYLFGAIASTIMAYNWSSLLAEKAFLMFVPESVAEYVEYANNYLPSVVKKFYKKVMVIQSIVESIVMFGANLFLIWLFNTALLQILIWWRCKKINITTMDIAARNALAGAIPASILLLIWNLIGIIPFPITKLIIAIEGFPVIGWMIVPAILLIFNLSFGAIGKAVALSQGCAEQPVEEFNNHHPYPVIDHPYQQCSESHPYKHEACDINGIIGCLPTEVISPGIIESFNTDSVASCYSDLHTKVCGNKPFGKCNNIKEQIIPLNQITEALINSKN